MWTYVQTNGRLYTPDGTHAGTGYAGGNCGRNPEGINNHEKQHVRNIGPIPVGIYTKGQVVLKSHLGPFAIPLKPDKDNDMGGRGHFYMHGDTNPSGNASQGCIIQWRAVREDFYNSKEKRLKVVATEEDMGKPV